MEEKGVLPGSKSFFHTPSYFAKQALYHPLNSGSFICSSSYETKREHLQQFVFIHILKGKMEVNYKNQQTIASDNSFIFLDCFNPHLYKTLEETHFNWIHFNGNVSKEYFEYFSQKKGVVFSLENNWEIPKCMSKILSMMEDEKVDEHETSLIIHQILYELEKVTNQADYSMEETIKKAISFIEDHYNEEIDLNNIADNVMLSPYHFSRVFKKHTNLTPHQYLIKFRVHKAKKLLFSTNLSVNEIALECGFYSGPHFVTTFKNHTDFTPKKYREFLFKNKN